MTAIAPTLVAAPLTKSRLFSIVVISCPTKLADCSRYGRKGDRAYSTIAPSDARRIRACQEAVLVPPTDYGLRLPPYRPNPHVPHDAVRFYGSRSSSKKSP